MTRRSYCRECVESNDHDNLGVTDDNGAVCIGCCISMCLHCISEKEAEYQKYCAYNHYDYDEIELYCSVCKSVKKKKKRIDKLKLQILYLNNDNEEEVIELKMIEKEKIAEKQYYKRRDFRNRIKHDKQSLR
jgi:hypothetical protein